MPSRTSATSRTAGEKPPPAGDDDDDAPRRGGGHGPPRRKDDKDKPEEKGKAEAASHREPKLMPSPANNPNRAPRRHALPCVTIRGTRGGIRSDLLRIAKRPQKPIGNFVQQIRG